MPGWTRAPPSNCTLTWRPVQVEEVFFLIGEGANRAESLALIGQIQAQGQVEVALAGCPAAVG